MFERIKAVLGSRGHPFGVLAGGLLVITFLTAGAGIWHHKYELAHQKPSAQTEKIAKNSSKQSIQSSDSGSSQTVLGEVSPTNTQQKSPTQKPTPKTTNQTPRGTAPANSTSSATPQNPGTVSAFLSVNDTSKGNVTLAANSNHCDVLSQALKNGLISSLDLRYSSQYGTYAVYMIDGVGDSNAVWWTYMVNGKSPPYGCSQMPVKDGDSVNWSYVKE